MDVFSYTNENVSTFPLTRLFKALVLDFNNLILKLIPQAIKSIDIIQGDGGAGTVKQINIIRGSQLIGVKNRVDELNEETFAYRYSLIDQTEKFESIAHEVKLEPMLEGGSKNKLTSKYYTKVMLSSKKRTLRWTKRDSWKYTRSAKQTSSKPPMLMLEPSKALLNKFEKSCQ